MTDEQSKRPRGILTPADRQYLTGQRDLSQGAERNTRQRIRERIRHSVCDFELLWELLPDDDLEQTFHPDDEATRQRIRASSQCGLSLLLLGLWRNRDPHPDRLEDAITQAFYADNKLAHVDIGFEIESVPDGELLLAKLKHKEERIEEIRERLETEDLRESKRTVLEQELQQERHYVYFMFEKALTDPSVDAEGLSEIRLLRGSDLSAELIEKEQQGWEEAQLQRQPLPVVLNTRYVGTEDGE